MLLSNIYQKEYEGYNYHTNEMEENLEYSQTTEKVSIYEHSFYQDETEESYCDEMNKHELDYKEALKAIICPESLVESRDYPSAKKREKSHAPEIRSSRKDPNFNQPDELSASIWAYGIDIPKRKKQRFFSQGRVRRKKSILRVIRELENFKKEVQKRYKLSTINHGYVFPRKQKSIKVSPQSKNIKTTHVMIKKNENASKKAVFIVKKNHNSTKKESSLKAKSKKTNKISISQDRSRNFDMDKSRSEAKTGFKNSSNTFSRSIKDGYQKYLANSQNPDRSGQNSLKKSKTSKLKLISSHLSNSERSQAEKSRSLVKKTASAIKKMGDSNSYQALPMAGHAKAMKKSSSGRLKNQHSSMHKMSQGKPGVSGQVKNIENSENKALQNKKSAMRITPVVTGELIPDEESDECSRPENNIRLYDTYKIKSASKIRKPNSHSKITLKYSNSSEELKTVSKDGRFSQNFKKTHKLLNSSQKVSNFANALPSILRPIASMTVLEKKPKQIPQVTNFQPKGIKPRKTLQKTSSAFKFMPDTGSQDLTRPSFLNKSGQKGQTCKKTSKLSKSSNNSRNSSNFRRNLKNYKNLKNLQNEKIQQNPSQKFQKFKQKLCFYSNGINKSHQEGLSRNKNIYSQSATGNSYGIGRKTNTGRTLKSKNNLSQSVANMMDLIKKQEDYNSKGTKKISNEKNMKSAANFAKKKMPKGMKYQKSSPDILIKEEIDPDEAKEQVIKTRRQGVKSRRTKPIPNKSSAYQNEEEYTPRYVSKIKPIIGNTSHRELEVTIKKSSTRNLKEQKLSRNLPLKPTSTTKSKNSPNFHKTTRYTLPKSSHKLQKPSNPHILSQIMHKNPPDSK
ncbi:unnamed protein product [Moneuplotes crassus]|uniref:Uncharacterized protein n=1 Tax=Euplotes crassus TaxID=5936 RepID=A0AAD2D2J0_EUPCR|nr:unnamed protein product [Moneuplotes crassus]